MKERGKFDHSVQTWGRKLGGKNGAGKRHYYRILRLYVYNRDTRKYTS